jgi:hypothetical protein
MRHIDADIEIAITISIVIGVLLIMAIAITVPVPKNCKITGTVKVHSVILVGSLIVPHTYNQPIYDCAKQD